MVRRSVRCVQTFGGPSMSLLRHLDYPPVWLAVFMVLAWFMGSVWAPLGDWGVWPGRLMIAAGIAVAVWSALAFRRARTTLVPRGEPEALVEDGPYRWSRNPIYAADLLILAGWCLNVGSVAALLLLIPFWRVLEVRFIDPEEALLSQRLGARYEAFRTRTRRWI